MAKFCVNWECASSIFIEAENEADADAKVGAMSLRQALEESGLDVSDHCVEVTEIQQV